MGGSRAGLAVGILNDRDRGGGQLLTRLAIVPQPEQYWLSSWECRIERCIYLGSVVEYLGEGEREADDEEDSVETSGKPEDEG